MKKPLQEVLEKTAIALSGGVKEGIREVGFSSLDTKLSFMEGRGEWDFWALLQRFGGGEIGAGWRESMEEVRLEALGFCWRGVADNLMWRIKAQEGSLQALFQRESCQLLAKQKMALRAFLRESFLPYTSPFLGLWSHWIQGIAEKKKEALYRLRDEMKDLLRNREAYQERCLELERLLMTLLEEEKEKTPHGKDSSVLEKPQKRPLESKARRLSLKQSKAVAEGAVRGSLQGQEERHYKVYTRSFDRVKHATELSDRESLVTLERILDKESQVLRGLPLRLSKKLVRLLQHQQRYKWHFDCETGYLHAGRLHCLATSKRKDYLYRWQEQAPFPNTSVSLLVDNSGSMRGRPILLAAVAVDLLIKTLEKCRIPCDVLGFTTTEWKGGRCRRKWIEDGMPCYPGRLNELLHIIYKPFQSSWRNKRRGLALMLQESLLKENIDGEALLWASKRLMMRRSQRQILMVISDGDPVDDATTVANTHGFLSSHLRHVIHQIQTRTLIELVAIGIGHNVGQYYEKSVEIRSVEELPVVMMESFLALFSSPEGGKAG